MTKSKHAAPLKKSLNIIETKLVISNYEKMKPPLNSPKLRQNIPVGFLKKQEQACECPKAGI